MTLVDTSVWVEYLRDGDAGAADWVEQNLGSVSVTEPVEMELLAGSRPGAQAARIERLLSSQRRVPLDPAPDHRGAVDVYWAARATGHQPRSLIDCLVAAIALRVGEPVAHRDVDFERIAAATGLRTIDLR